MVRVALVTRTRIDDDITTLKPAFVANAPAASAERIVRETLKEAKRCTQSGIKINTFMLGTEYYRRGFIDQVSRLNTGRVFYTSPDQIGNYIVVDYLANKRKRIGRA